MSRNSRRQGQPDRRLTSYARQREEHERAASTAARRAADLQAAERRVAEAGLSNENSPDNDLGRLIRLGELSSRLDDIRLQQLTLLKERDRLIGELRSDGITWEQLAARTGLSRQALSKRRAT